MRLTAPLAAALCAAVLCAACAGSEDRPPILPRTGTWRVEESEWLEQSEFRDITFFTSLYVEERSAHFGMTWGGGHASGDCRVAENHWFQCPTSETVSGDERRGAVWRSTMTGWVTDEVWMELENEITAECVGPGCTDRDEPFHGIEVATISIQQAMKQPWER